MRTFLGMTAGLDATLFVAYALLLLARPSPTDEWKRASVLPKFHRWKARANYAGTLVASWIAAIVPAVYIGLTLSALGRDALGGATPDGDAEALVWLGSGSVIILLMYILGWPLLTKDVVQTEVLELRSRRFRRMRNRLLTTRNEHKDEMGDIKANRRLLAALAPSMNDSATASTQAVAEGMPTSKGHSSSGDDGSDH